MEEGEVPAELLALIGAPMPEVDLTIEGPDDVERWLSEWFRWRRWVDANPREGLQLLGEGVALDSEYERTLGDGLNRQVEADAALLGGPLLFTEVTADFSVAAEGSIVLRFQGKPTTKLYRTTLLGVVVSESDASGGSPSRGEAILFKDGDRWLVASWVWL